MAASTPRLQDIERAVSPSTRAIIVNSPNNPSGTVYSSEFIAQIVDFCERKKIYLIMDDIYHKLVFDGNKAVPAYQFTRNDIESTMVIVVNGVSKLYGMTGFRIGWVVTNRKLVQVMNNVQAQTTSCTSVVLQAAAEGALNGLQSAVEGLRLTIENNRNVTMEELKSFKGIKVAKPGGTFYCLPDFRAYTNNSEQLSDFLLKESPGRHCSRERIWDGRLSAPQLCWDCQRYHHRY